MENLAITNSIPQPAAALPAAEAVSPTAAPASDFVALLALELGELARSLGMRPAAEQAAGGAEPESDDGPGSATEQDETGGAAAFPLLALNLPQAARAEPQHAPGLRQLAHSAAPAVHGEAYASSRATMPLPANGPDQAATPSPAVTNQETFAKPAADPAVGGESLPRASEDKLLPVAFAEGRPAEAAFAHALPAIASHPVAQRAEHAIPAAHIRIDIPVGDPGWDEALGQHVVRIAGRSEQAELHLNPPHLGPVDVTLSVADDRVTIDFVAQQPAVREAIEAALPALRTALAENGIELAQTTVSAEAFTGERDARPDTSRHGRSGSREETSVEARAAEAGRARLMREGLVDTFA